MAFKVVSGHSVDRCKQIKSENLKNKGRLTEPKNAENSTWSQKSSEQVGNPVKLQKKYTQTFNFIPKRMEKT